MTDSPAVSDRAGYIGGSDLAGILGLSLWTTPYQVFADKIGASVPRAYDADTEDRFFMGNLLEDAIAQAFTRKTGKPVVRSPLPFYRHATHTFMGGHVDFELFEEPALLECKNVRHVSDDWGKQDDPDRAPECCIPLYYLTQVDHYMAVRGFTHAYLAALFGGVELRYWKIPRSAEREQIVIEAERRFWERVTNDDPPPPQTIDDVMLKLQRDYEGIANKGRRSDRKRVVVTTELRDTLFRALVRSRKAATKAKKESDLLKASILALVQGPADFVEEFTGEKIGRLTLQARKGFLVRAFSEAHPDIAASYQHETISPRITIEGEDDDEE